MDQTALLIIDAQQEYFAPIGKVVLPDGPRAVVRIAETLRWAMDVEGPDGVVIPHDQVHRTHLRSRNRFLAEVKRTAEVIGAWTGS